jgi:hypothetical protein
LISSRETSAELHSLSQSSTSTSKVDYLMCLIKLSNLLMNQKQQIVSINKKIITRHTRSRRRRSRKIAQQINDLFLAFKHLKCVSVGLFAFATFLLFSSRLGPTARELNKFEYKKTLLLSLKLNLSSEFQKIVIVGNKIEHFCFFYSFVHSFAYVNPA